MQPSDHAAIEQHWNAGLADLAIAEKTLCSLSTVCRWRKKAGLPPNPPASSSMTQEARETAARLAAEGMPVREIAERVGFFVETVRKYLIRSSIAVPAPARRTVAREVHGTIGAGGYVELLVDRDGPYANLVCHGSGRRGYAALHRMRMQDALGRELLPGEVVHHIDGDIYNNSPSNLAVFASSRDHLDHHLETGLARCKEAPRQ